MCSHLLCWRIERLDTALAQSIDMFDHGLIGNVRQKNLPHGLHYPFGCCFLVTAHVASQVVTERAAVGAMIDSSIGTYVRSLSHTTDRLRHPRCVVVPGVSLRILLDANQFRIRILNLGQLSLVPARRADTQRQCRRWLSAI
jgi:hypothetical protein